MSLSDRETVVAVKALWSFIVENMERESIFLTPDPQWEINAHSVLEKMEEVFQIPPGLSTIWTRELRQAAERRKKSGGKRAR